MKLPAPIQVFFDAEKGSGDKAPVRAFAPNAIVKDEGKLYVGHDAIETWWLAAKAQYQHTSEPREIVKQRHRTIVRAQVSGQFAGSPALLTFAFLLENERIGALEITA